MIVDNKIMVKTSLGTLVVYENPDQDYPGVFVDLQRDGFVCDAPVAMIEVTETEWDLDGPHLISRIWDNVSEEDYNTRVVHFGFEKHFDNRERI